MVAEEREQILGNYRGFIGTSIEISRMLKFGYPILIHAKMMQPSKETSYPQNIKEIGMVSQEVKLRKLYLLK